MGKYTIQDVQKVREWSGAVKEVWKRERGERRRIEGGWKVDV